MAPTWWKPAGRVLAAMIFIHVCLWAWSVRRVNLPVLPSLVRSVLTDWAEARSAGGLDSLSETPWVLLVCSEDAQILGPSGIASIQRGLPSGWNVADQAHPPAPAVLSSNECSKCTLICSSTVWATPFVSLVDSSWWGGHLAASGYRHLGVHLGHWFIPIRTWQTWMS